MSKSEKRVVTFGEPKVTRIDYTIPKENWKYNNMGMFVNTVPYPAGISAKKVCYVDNISECLFVNTHNQGITFFAEKELDTFAARITIYSSEYMPKYSMGG